MTEYITKGVSPSLITQISLTLLPAILVQTFAMSVLLAALLSFGRLSSDSEIVAIRASGVSLFRIIAPVSVFSLVIAILAFSINETVVPLAAKRSAQLLDQVARSLDGTNYKDTSYPISEKGKLRALVVAKDFVPSQGILRGATIVGFKDSGPQEGDPDVYLYANALQFDPKQFKEGGGWRIQGSATITRADGSEVIHLKEGAWPPELPQATFSIGDLLSKGLKSFELVSMRELREIIEKNKQAEGVEGAKTLSPKELRNYQYGYWNKLALPLAALIFGTLGAALGIRNHRTGTAAGFALAVGIIFAYFTVGNFMNVWALNGLVPAYVASFSPIAIGLVASVIIIWRRNA